MDVVLVDERSPSFGNTYYLTLVRVKLHEPVPFPLLWFIEIFPEKELIFFDANNLVDKYFISEESYGGRDALWYVIYVDKEQQRSNDCSVRYS